MPRIARVAVLAVFAACAGTACAQDAPTPPAQADPSLPDAADLFRKHIAAIGGEDAIRSHRNRVSRGRAQSQPSGEFALVTVWQEAPERLHTRFEVPGQPPVDSYFSDGYAWRILGGSRAELIRNEPLRELRDDADFFGDLEFSRRYREMRTVEKVTSSKGDDLYRVHVVFTYGKDEMHFFDAQTGLRVGVLTSSITPEGQVPIGIAYEDFRTVAGVRIPHKVIITTNRGAESESVTTITFNSIQANVPSVPSWDMPASLMELVKQYEAENPQTPPPAAG